MRRSAGMAAAAALLVAVAVVLPGGAPAGAQASLVLTVTPSTGIRHQDTVTVEVTGLPADNVSLGFSLCDDPLPPEPTADDLSHCSSLGSVATDGQPTWSVGVPLSEVFDVFPPPEFQRESHYCSDEPFGCSVVATLGPFDGGPPGQVVSQPVDFTPSPLLVSGFLTDTTPADVFVVGEPGATLTLAQCLDYPNIPRELASCLSGPQVTLPAGGRASTQITFAPTQVVGGVTYACASRPCQVVAFDAGGNEVSAIGIPGSYPSARVTLAQSTNIPPGATVRATIENSSAINVLGECLAAVIEGEMSPTAGCKLFSVLPVGTYELDLTIEAEFTPYAGGAPVVCADDPGGCVVGIGNGLGNGISWYVPVTFGPPPSLTLTPSTGLLDGQAMSIEATGLVPDRTYRLARCSLPATSHNCVEFGEVAASAEGTYSATVPAAAVLDAPMPVFCRDACMIALIEPSNGSFVAHAGYAMATGELSATPSTGLVDGQTVTVSGTGIMPTYDGRFIWIVHTGQWALAQCDAGILVDRTLLGVFTHCAGVPGGGPGDIGGSTVSHPVEVAADLEKILGGTTDCTAAAGNCVVALLRMELDGGITVHSAALTFV